MKLGACDFLRKPYEMEDILLATDSAGRTFRQASQLDLYRRRAWEAYTGEEIIGRSTPMRIVREMIEKVVRSQATSVLITGESGTGKELVARAIHYRSDRAQAPLMEVNCSSFHENLLENELFGHEKGAFTDASTTKKGLVELCDGGTLFLDEVADMPMPTQAKLLRFIDHRNFKRVGGAQDIAVDIRIVAATNKDLEAEVRAGRFRSDLYFRLKVVSIPLPPLRDRGEDILLLGRHFIREFAKKFQKPFADLAPRPPRRSRATPGRATCASCATPSSASCCSRTATRCSSVTCRPSCSAARRRSSIPMMAARIACRRSRRWRPSTSPRCCDSRRATRAAPRAFSASRARD
jgi:DNA-binding NtrC family response regulator